MYLKGWKYEGRRISRDLHELFFCIAEIIKSPEKVGNKSWPELQATIAEELGTTTGQVRTIKRMMESLGIIYEGSLNSNDVPDKTIFTEDGESMLKIIETELAAAKNPTKENKAYLIQIEGIYRLFYLKAFLHYTIVSNDGILHPFVAVIKALKRFDYLDYWEWYILNTFINDDSDCNDFSKIDELITKYRRKELSFSENDIIENKLSHSYILGNFASTGLIEIVGKKSDKKIMINNAYSDYIDDICEMKF